MDTIRIEYQGTDLNYAKALQVAKGAAMEQRIQEPAVLAWHQRSSHAMSPSYEGADPNSWWEKYGVGNGGRLEISVADEFDFVVMETRGFETVDQLPIRNLVAQDGQEYICLTPMLGDANSPNAHACIPLDEWAADQY